MISIRRITRLLPIITFSIFTILFVIFAVLSLNEELFFKPTMVCCTFCIVHLTLLILIPDYFEMIYIELAIDNSLISIGAFEEVLPGIYKTPSIKVSTDEKRMEIELPDINTRKKVEGSLLFLSNALPSNYVADRTYLSKDEKTLYVEYLDIRDSNRYIFEEPYSFVKALQSVNKYELMLDKKTTINLLDTPHILITGSSGSGKTYFTQEIIAQGLLKGFEISILDYKRSYQAFSDYCKTAFNIDEILTELENIINDLHRRQGKMDIILKTRPAAVAADYGDRVRLVVIEEYIALMNSGADKKTLDRIEKMIMELITTGRALNIHVMMVMQVSSSNNLNTSIRANLPVRLLFGTPDRTTFSTTFTTGDFPEMTSKKEKGEGYIYVDGCIYTFSAPTLLFDITESLTYIKSFSQ